ncbi:MAG: class I SAM-dependent methyltransferase, partial [Bradyrhizobium sp.]
MSDPINDVQQLVDEYLISHRGVTVLEAGCGSMSKVNFGSDARTIGIDISAQQLQRNTKLHEKILGDLHTYPLPKESFDIIICWDVLEHLERPREVLRNFFGACKPGGLIILAFPNLFSLKGLLTKLAPYRIHVWYYKYFLGWKDAGAEDTCPFPTPFRLAMAYPQLKKCAMQHNVAVELFSFRESGDMQFLRNSYSMINALFKVISVA